MIPNIIDYNLKKDYQFLIIFGTNIPDTTGHQMTIQLPTSPTSASALPAKNGTSETCVEINNNKLQFYVGLVALNSPDLRQRLRCRAAASLSDAV